MRAAVSIAARCCACLLSCLSACLPGRVSVCLICLPACPHAVCLPACLSVYLSICLTVYIYMFVSICLSVYLFVCLTVCLSNCLSVNLFVCLSVCLSICLSVYLYVCLSACLSIQFVCLSVCLSICLSVYLFVCLSVCMSICYLRTFQQCTVRICFSAMQSRLCTVYNISRQDFFNAAFSKLSDLELFSYGNNYETVDFRPQIFIVDKVNDVYDTFINLSQFSQKLHIEPF